MIIISLGKTLIPLKPSRQIYVTNLMKMPKILDCIPKNVAITKLRNEVNNNSLDHDDQVETMTNNNY